MFAQVESVGGTGDERDKRHDQRQGGGEEEEDELHVALRDAVVMLAENEPEDPFGALAAQYVFYFIRVSRICSQTLHCSKLSDMKENVRD